MYDEQSLNLDFKQKILYSGAKTDLLQKSSVLIRLLVKQRFFGQNLILKGLEKNLVSPKYVGRVG